jgi:hypothetical protein
MIIAASLFQPLFFNDMLYMGRAGDLQKFVSFDLWYEGEHAQLNAEQCFHSAPFLAQRPFLKSFYKANPGLIHESSEKAEQVYRVMFNSQLYLRSIHASLTILRDAYTVGMIDDEQEPWTEDFETVTLIELLNPDVVDRVRGLDYGRGGNALGFKHEACAPLLLRMPISAAEPRSLTDLFGTGDDSPGLDGRTLHEQSQDLARRLWQAFPSIADAPRPDRVEGGARFVSARDSYL